MRRMIQRVLPRISAAQVVAPTAALVVWKYKLTSSKVSPSCESNHSCRKTVGGPCPLVVCGPSGVGKGTFIKRLMEAYPHAFGFSVSHTTRAPRPGEVDGVHYHFVNMEDMRRQVDEGLFAEHAVFTMNLYGTSKKALESVQEEGRIAILDIDIQGAKQLKNNLGKAHFMFLSPPSMELLEQRLRGRGTENEDKIRVRLATAREEMEFSQTGFFEFVVVADDDLVKAWDEIICRLESWYPHIRTAYKEGIDDSAGSGKSARAPSS